MIRVGVLMDADSPHGSGYLHAVAAATGVQEIGITDPTGTIIAQAKKQKGAETKNWRQFRDASELLKQLQPEFVIVTYPGDRTPPYVAKALEANCHVLAEKPACAHVADFAKLARTADSKHRNIMLAVANRSHPLMDEARAIIQGGSIGRPYAAHILMVADQTRLKRPEYAKSWTASKARGFGGFLAWLSIHYVDLLQHLTSDRFTQVSAMIGNANRLPLEVEDSVVLNLAMSKGLLATCHGGYYMDKGYQSGFQVWGSDGWLRFSLHGPGERVLEWTSYKTGKSEKKPATTDGSAYDWFVQDAITRIANNSAPRITTAESLHLLQTVDAAYRSAATRQQQAVPA